MKSAFITVALSALVRSPLNVRETKAEDPAIGQLASSILTKGLISPIAIHALAKPKGKFGVLAGDRRWQAIKKLQADGAAFDFEAIPVNLCEGTDAELTEISLAENYVRQGMRPPEIYSAFRAIRERNPKIADDELAEHYGLEKQRVSRIMRLAFLHPKVFEAYDAGKLKDEEAFAYAATEDQALQLQTFELLSKRPEWQRRPHDIRGAMKVGDDEQRRLLGFVTLEAYEAAGGAFEVNLFADKANEGRVLDEELLRRLANEKLESSRAGIIAQYGDRGEITFVDRPPADQYGSSYDFRVREEEAEPTDEQAARITVLQERDSEIETILDGYDLFDEDGDPLPEHAEKVEALEAEQEKIRLELQEIEDSLPRILPEGPKLATFMIGQDGKAEVQFYWEKRPRAKAGGGVTIVGRAPIVDPAKEVGLSADSLQVMRSTYRSITQALVAQAAEDGRDFALDYLLFSQVKASLNLKVNYYSGTESWSSPDRTKVGLANNLTPSRTMDKLEAEVAHQPAAIYMAGLRDALIAEPCFAHHDAVAGFEMFQHADEGVVRRCIGFLATIALDRSLNLSGFDRQNRFIDYIGNTLTEGSSTPVREIWTPDAIYLNRLAKKHKLAILERIGGADLVARTKGMKAGEIGDFVERILRCSDEDVQLLGIDEETVATAIQWLPSYLAYPTREEIDRRAPPAPKPPEPKQEPVAEDEHAEVIEEAAE